MKKGIFTRAVAIMTMIVSLAWVLTGCKVDLSISEDDKKYDTNAKFSYNDLVLGDLKYGMTEKQLVDIMGMPEEKIKSGPEDTNIYGESILYRYKDLYVTFYLHNDNMVLSSVTTESPRYRFTKGLKVGDTKEKVISSFYRESKNENELRDIISTYDTSKAFGKYLYGHGINDVTDAVKESSALEYAYINYTGFNKKDTSSTYMIEYHYLKPPYISQYASNDDEKACLVFDVNNEDVVTCIRWYYEPRV